MYPMNVITYCWKKNWSWEQLLQRKRRFVVSKRKAKSLDDEYYITSMPPNQLRGAGLSMKGNDGFVSNRFDAAVLDLVADDSSGIKKQRAQHHWDKKSKKCVKLNNGKHVTASGKLELHWWQRGLR